MIVYNTGSIPGAAVVAQLCLPDAAATTSQVLETLTVTADSTGRWQFDGLNELHAGGSAKIKAQFGLTPAQAGLVFWRVTDPRPGGADATVWTIVPPTSGGQANVASVPTATSAPAPSGGGAVTAAAVIASGVTAVQLGGAPSGAYVAPLSYAGPPTYTPSATPAGAVDRNGVVWQWTGSAWTAPSLALTVALGG